METLFSSHYQTASKGLDTFYRISSQRNMNIIATIGIVFLSASLIWILVLGQYDPIPLLLTCAGLVLCVVMLLFYKIMSRIAYKNAMKLHGGFIPPTDILFEEKCIRMTEGKFSFRFQYSEVTAIYYKHHIFALMMGKSNGLLIPEDTISGGTSAQFGKFITDRCTEAKIH